MTNPREYTILEEVVEKAAANGISREDLVNMVALSARFTHPEGNRRYETIGFKVVGLEVIDLFSIEEEMVDPNACHFCKGTKRVRVFDGCPHCNGSAKGCKRCDAGLVPGEIDCQFCA